MKAGLTQKRNPGAGSVGGAVGSCALAESRGHRCKDTPPVPGSLCSTPPSCRCCLSATSPLHRPPERTKQAGEEQLTLPAPTLVGCILMVCDWIGCALNSLLGRQEEGREESLIHQTEILIDFQPAGVGHGAPTMEKERGRREKVGTAEEERSCPGRGRVTGGGKGEFVRELQGGLLRP